MASLATAADMRERYDERRLGNLCSDTGTQVNPEDLAANSAITTCLSTATGRVKASLFRGNIYNETDLTNLTAESLEFVKDLVCVVAYYLLIRRKHVDMEDDMYKLAKQDYEEALKDLRTGEITLELEAQHNAGVVELDAIQRVEAPRWSLISDRSRGRMLPQRRTYDNR